MGNSYFGEDPIFDHTFPPHSAPALQCSILIGSGLLCICIGDRTGPGGGPRAGPGCGPGGPKGPGGPGGRGFIWIWFCGNGVLPSSTSSSGLVKQQPQH